MAEERDLWFVVLMVVDLSSWIGEFFWKTWPKEGI